MSFHTCAFLQLPSAYLASSAVLFLINRRVRRERKGFGYGLSAQNYSPIPSAFLAPFAVLYLINRRVRRDRKDFCKDALPNFPHYSLRSWRPLRFYFINRRARGDL